MNGEISLGDRIDGERSGVWRSNWRRAAWRVAIELTASGVACGDRIDGERRGAQLEMIS